MIGAVESASPDGRTLLDRFGKIRAATEALAAPLSAEDCQIQSMPDASPTKWHLAHTSWFFETFLLEPHLRGYAAFDPAFAVLFNSYYVQVGDRHPRPQRGLLSRPSLDAVRAYRRHVDAAMEQLLAAPPAGISDLVELGLQHEQQHQELILMDIQHALAQNPLQPTYHPDAPTAQCSAEPSSWIEMPGGLYEIGHHGGGFAFDNEGPRHRVWLEPFAIADRIVTAGEYRTFIEDGGYRRPELWLSDGWAAVEGEGWDAPIYWRRDGAGWSSFGLRGGGPIDPNEPLVHVSYYEADAFARWADARLPTEAEWEVSAARGVLRQQSDCGWQWTASPYVGYPGYQAPEGAVGEYNGKFMVNQMVLRGGAAITPPDHVRLTYRNFFPPGSRWMASAIRLARQA